MTPLLRTLFVAILLVAFAIAPSRAQTDKPLDAKGIGLTSVLPLNPAVRTGTLENGLKYFILHNAKPEHRAELRLALNAGSVLETDAQQGLAHFCEHMCFNGTKNFNKDALVRYMESIGMRFGADVNAYTSFDETVYMLQIPTDKPDIIDHSFQILRDWAHDVTFDGAEIDKERGVIIEEMRGRKGAAQRLQDKHFPVVYHDSKYAQRLPIGKEDILTSFQHETLRQFYRDWYRPDLMAVIVVGDIDMDATEKMIREKFSSIPRPAASVVRTTTPVPDHPQTLYSIAADPEVTSTSIALYMKYPPRPMSKAIDYRNVLIDGLIDEMLNDRLDELTRRADPPYIRASAGYGGMTRGKDAFQMRLTVTEQGIERGFEAALTELARVRQHGYTATELERAKTGMLRSTEERYNERDKTESRGLASGLVNYFLTAEAEPGIALEFGLQKRFLPAITIAEINNRMKERFIDGNTVVTVSIPEKSGAALPKEERLREIQTTTLQRPVEAYVDKVANTPLAVPPANRVTITDERALPELGVTEWRLSNGIRVVVKPTQFKNDEILFSAFSPGGSSLVSDADQLSATLATAILSQSGVSEFSLTDLKKLLTGKVVSVSPTISELEEGFSGSVSPKDLETLFQLVYLHFTAPRQDTAAYQAFVKQMHTMLKNAGSQPEAVFRDTASTVMAQYHARRRPLTAQRLEELRFDRAMEVYRDRFADAGDFTFFFVGNVDPATLKPLVLRYFGSLPTTGRKETWRDLGITQPPGIVDRTVRKGLEKKSTVLIYFTGPFEWNAQNKYELTSLIEILRMKLREQVREEKGGTYGVQVMGAPDHYPRGEYRIVITFGCNPDRADELTKVTLDVLRDVATNGVTQEYVDKTKEIQRRERETNLKENRWWQGRLRTQYVNGDDPMEIMQYDTLVEGLTPAAIKQTAAQYLNMQHYARFVLLPEK
jgi:zinc protease